MAYWEPDRAKLPDLMARVDRAIGYGTALANKKNPVDRIIGKQWVVAAKKLREELDWAQANWNSQELHGAVDAVQLPVCPPRAIGAGAGQDQLGKSQGEIVGEHEAFVP